MLNRDPPRDFEFRRWSLYSPPVPSNTFELALALGGTASAGAFTAGAVDFLIEALDCWESAKGLGDPNIPEHRVVLRVITGTSGGALTAAIAARALNFSFPHPSLNSIMKEDVYSGNPFYDIWINSLDLTRFLAINDYRRGLPPSVLDTTAIEAAASLITSFSGIEKRDRDWIESPLRVILTLRNLAGVPFYGLSKASTAIYHADFVRFAINYRDQAAEQYRPDEFVLSFEDVDAPSVAWLRFKEFVAATSTFPPAFAARTLARPAEHYRWRIVSTSAYAGSVPTAWALIPNWDTLLETGALSSEGDYFFLADGEARYDVLVELARTSLSGLLGENPRDGQLANRAVILIDPLPGTPELAPQPAATLVESIAGGLPTWLQQSDYNMDDLLLASAPDVFSRFILSPVQHIASAGLNGFLGFTSPALRRHDYFLGRLSCQQFLSHALILPSNNEVFSRWTYSQKALYSLPSGFLPLIPLTGTAREPQLSGNWPKVTARQYRSQIEQRYRYLLSREVGGGRWRRILGYGIGLLTQRAISDRAIDLIERAIEIANPETL